MKYNKIVQEKIDVLNKYTVDVNLSTFNILHLYPEKKPAYPNGYYDSRFFQLWGFNTETMSKLDLGRHDGLSMYSPDYPKVIIIQIFADGSTLVKFAHKVSVEQWQNATIKTAF